MQELTGETGNEWASGAGQVGADCVRLCSADETEKTVDLS